MDWGEIDEEPSLLLSLSGDNWTRQSLHPPSSSSFDLLWLWVKCSNMVSTPGTSLSGPTSFSEESLPQEMPFSTLETHGWRLFGKGSILCLKRYVQGCSGSVTCHGEKLETHDMSISRIMTKQLLYTPSVEYCAAYKTRCSVPGVAQALKWLKWKKKWKISSVFKHHPPLALNLVVL